MGAENFFPRIRRLVRAGLSVTIDMITLIRAKAFARNLGGKMNNETFQISTSLLLPVTVCPKRPGRFLLAAVLMTVLPSLAAAQPPPTGVIIVQPQTVPFHTRVFPTQSEAAEIRKYLDGLPRLALLQPILEQSSKWSGYLRD